jgi:hypothetical protein
VPSEPPAPELPSGICGSDSERPAQALASQITASGISPVTFRDRERRVANGDILRRSYTE